MPAFTAVEDISGENQGAVFFEKSNIHARKKAANYFADGELRGLRVNRAPNLDQYEQDKCVPLYVMIDMGWNTECCNCYVKINSDLYYEDSHKNCVPVGFFDSTGFCSKKCEKQWDKEQAEKSEIKRVEILRLKTVIDTNFFGAVFEEPNILQMPYVHKEKGKYVVGEATLVFAVNGVRVECLKTRKGPTVIRLPFDEEYKAKVMLSAKQGFKEKVKNER